MDPAKKKPGQAMPVASFYKRISPLKETPQKKRSDTDQDVEESDDATAAQVRTADQPPELGGNLVQHIQRHVNASSEAKVVETSGQTLKAISNLERKIDDSIKVSAETVTGFFDTLKIRSDGLNRRVGGMEDLFQSVTNRLRDLKVEFTDGMGEITRSLNQLKLNVPPHQEKRQPDLRSLKTLKFSIGVESDLNEVKDLMSQGTQYDELDFKEEATKIDTASAIPQETVNVVTTDAGIAGKHARPSTSAVDKTVVKQPTKTDEVIQVEDDGQTQAEDDVVPEVDKESQGPAETVKDLEDLEESEALAADVLLDLQDVVDMTEQGLCSPENWPPKHSSQFVEEFKQEEVECAESTTEDSTVPPPPPKVIGTIEPARRSRRVRKKKY